MPSNTCHADLTSLPSLYGNSYETPSSSPALRFVLSLEQIQIRVYWLAKLICICELSKNTEFYDSRTACRPWRPRRSRRSTSWGTSGRRRSIRADEWRPGHSVGCETSMQCSLKINTELALPFSPLHLYLPSISLQLKHWLVLQITNWNIKAPL